MIPISAQSAMTMEGLYQSVLDGSGTKASHQRVAWLDLLVRSCDSWRFGLAVASGGRRGLNRGQECKPVIALHDARCPEMMLWCWSCYSCAMFSGLGSITCLEAERRHGLQTQTLGCSDRVVLVPCPAMPSPVCPRCWSARTEVAWRGTPSVGCRATRIRGPLLTLLVRSQFASSTAE